LVCGFASQARGSNIESLVLGASVFGDLIENVDILPVEFMFARNISSESDTDSWYKYIHTHHSRFIPEGVAEVSQIFL
jgi:hypothetical protein